MKFEEVLPALREGKKIIRKVWHPIEELSLNNQKETVIISDLLATDWEIIKEKKKEKIEEKKKVKLRDLTEEQFKKYCKNFTGNGKDCGKCVFHNVICASWYDDCWIKHKDLYSDKFLDQEVEVEE